jgi:hypothetical protein
MLLNPQRQNRYAYGLNNPYRYVDPDGEFAIIAALALGAFALDMIMPQSTNVPNSKGALDYMDIATMVAPVGVAPVGAIKNVTKIGKIKNVYKSVKDAGGGGFSALKNGMRKVNIKDKGLLSELRTVEKGTWKKVYRDGYNTKGQKASQHYFQSKSGKVFDLKEKSGWSNK